MKTTWWTCGCGKKQAHYGRGTPVCEACGKRAAFTVAPPRGQGGFDFETDETENEMNQDAKIRATDERILRLLEKIRDDDSGRQHFRHCRTGVYYPGLQAPQDDRCSICEESDAVIALLAAKIRAEEGTPDDQK